MAKAPGTTTRVEIVSEPDRVTALADPLRVAILDALRTPNSASGAARAIGETRQKTNHHVKALLDARLIRRTGERRSGNFVEQLYQSVAGTFVVSPRLAWSEGCADAMRQQLPLEHLVVLGERVQRDAIALLDRAAFDGDEIPSLAIDAEVSFPDGAARAAFMEEYLAVVQPLLRKHGARRGEPYRVAVAVYPDRGVVMEQPSRDDGFEVTFVVGTSRADAWARLESAQPVSDKLPAPRPGQWWMPVFEGSADELEVEPGRLLRVRKATFPCDGTEIVIAMEDAGTGSRITVAQFGFGPHFEEQRPWLAAGWAAIAADLAVFFEHGVVLARHLTPWASTGCDFTETPAGLVVGAVHPDGLASWAGMQPADLLISVAGAPVTTIGELSIIMRGPVRSGDTAKVRFLRDGKVLKATGIV